VSYQVFARKYRPKTFADVLGQDHVVQTLRNAIEQERLAHAYLFVGPRGTGKTSTARILSKALNCPNGPSLNFDPEAPICQEIAEGRSLDVLEIDGASNNGVEQVRELRDNVRFAPTSGRFKIYYIDEVHMLTNAAFNALLKTLEEPPEHVKFIFATTEPNKILPTIISRCQRFDLRPISTETIAKHLSYIAQAEGVTLEPAAAWAIAKGADGGMRDAQSMLDQLVAFCGEHIAESNVLDVFGFTSREIVARLTQNILTQQTPNALEILHQQANSGKELGQLLDDTIGCLRSLLVAQVDPSAQNDGIPAELWDPLCATAHSIPVDRLLNLVDIFAATESRMKWATNKRLHFEIGLIKAIQSLNNILISDVIKALAGAGPVDPSLLSSETKHSAPPLPKEPVSQEPVPQQVTAETSPAHSAQTSEPTSPQENLYQPEVTQQEQAPPTDTAPHVTSNSESPDQATQHLEADLIAPLPQKPDQPSLEVSANSETLPEQKPEKARARNINELTNRLDNLIASAPDEVDLPPESQIKASTPNSLPPQDSVPEENTPPAIDQDAFYKDPLIKKALEIFQGTLTN